MKQEIGTQYSKDKKTDPSGFMEKARLHQSIFRAEVLDVPFRRFGNYLTKEDAEKGLNFFDGFGIREEVKKLYPEFTKGLMDNLLRSDHIPFNFFIPIRDNKELGKKVFNEILSIPVESIDGVNIQFAPSPANRFLNDNTSFDALISYKNSDGEHCAVGIDVNYTERVDKLKADSKEVADLKNPESLYHIATKGCGVFKPESFAALKEDGLRQFWKKHLLGERLIYIEKDKYKKFTLLTLFPEGNEPLLKATKAYEDTLVNNKDNFKTMTFEAFTELCSKHVSSDQEQAWVDYLKARYLVG